MTMLKAVLLICALDVAPADCLPETALDVLAGPETGNVTACGLHAQAFLAQSALAQGMRDGEYLKIVCLPPEAPVGLTRRPQDPAAAAPFAERSDAALSPAAGLALPLRSRRSLPWQ